MVASVILLCVPHSAYAYVGPGAGFAVLSSFLVLFTTVVAAALAMVVWPFRALWRVLRGRVTRRRIGRLVVIGFDGQDPTLTEQFMAAGTLPNFAKLAATGSYRRLETTFPAVSPVAWSSFSTGTHPARHNIFDFLTRDRRTYLPVLSSTHLGAVERFVKLGRYLIPRHRPELRLLRKSKPFWAILGEHQIWSTILRVPVSFPPDVFYGAELSAMCVPDLLGTQGTFLLFTTRPHQPGAGDDSIRISVTRRDRRIDSTIEGPPNPFVVDHPPLTVPFSMIGNERDEEIDLTVGETTLRLPVGVLSDWVRLSFRAAPGVTVTGLARFQLLEAGEHVSLYVSPINLDPEKPALPISHPPYFASYLAKRIGPFATLGLAEDTWALNEAVTSEATFLAQTYDIDRERRAMLFAALDRVRRGTVVCVFDATDRVQHMFWRYLDPTHPARPALPSPNADAIRDVYARNDELLGTVLQRLAPDDVLMVISDHGFSSFRRGVNLNAWLRDEGYLTLRPGTDGSSKWLGDVDWSRSRAYCLGLTGIFLNVRGREQQGIVEPGAEADALRAELIARLQGMTDPVDGDVAIRAVFDPRSLYEGPYLENGPDLLVGYNAGYRVSWGCASGVVAGALFEDNRKAWSGDHCIDPRLVPGVFFCNKRVETASPSLVDLAPTALRLFGIEPPRYMDGRALEVAV